jgi:Domain of unknown function (DUF4258)
MPLSKRQATEAIRKALTAGSIRPLPHAQQRMIERGIDMNDVRSAIRSGVVVSEETPGRYRLDGPAVDPVNRRIAVVFEIESSDVPIITVFEVQSHEDKIKDLRGRAQQASKKGEGEEESEGDAQV